MLRKLYITALFAAVAIAADAQLVINEIMQSNIDCIMDDLNDFPDSWVELYNTGTAKVNLKDYSIGVTENADEAWRLPNITVAGGGYHIVYCDKVGEDNHTPFRLESGKDCRLFLFCNGELVDQLPSGMKKQPAPNIAYGRQNDGTATWGYQLTPTPGESNCGRVCSNKNILEPPVFSLEGCVFSPGEELYVELMLPDNAPAGTKIYYTTDGSEPTTMSLPYTQTLMITRSMVIRAKTFCDGYLSPRSLTQSYLQIDRDVTLPIVSIATDRKYLTDKNIGIYVDGSYSSSKKNYEYNWRRPVNIEYFGDDIYESILNQLCETRIAGAASRSQSLKTLAIYANKRFGEKRFNYEFFPDQKPGLTEFKSLMLRNAGNDFDYLYMRDAVIQRLMATYTDLDWQAWSPAIFFLNGEYKGMLNIRERSNEDNIFTNYGGLEDIHMVENWWELKEGDINVWNEFMAFYDQHGHTWDEYNEVMDVEEFLNVMIMNLFFCNLDFPGNNYMMWRPKADGGRWRVVVKDTDFGLGLYGRDSDYKIFEWLYNPNYDWQNNWGANGYEGTRLFRRLMEDETFYREFIDRFAIYMGDFLNFERTWEVWEPMYDKIKYEYPRHRALFNPWWPNYEQELNSAKSWLQNRVPRIYDQINAYYKTGTPKSLTINSLLDEDDLADISVTFNGVKLSRGTFNGKFFAGRQITLKGENVEGWDVSETTSTGVKSRYIDGDTYTFTISNSTSSVTINAKPSVNGINDIVVDDIDAAGAPTEYYDITGRRLQAPANGITIVRTPSGTKKILK